MTDITHGFGDALTREQIRQMFRRKAMECSDKAIDEFPILHVAWGHKWYRERPGWHRHRKVEDSAFSFAFFNDRWPTPWELREHLAREAGISPASAAAWISDSIKSTPGESFIAMIPATDETYVSMPTIKARRSPSGTSLVFRCPYCGLDHLHGTDEGHRRPHCVKETPFANGYILKESPELDDWRIALVREVWFYTAARFFIACAEAVEAA